jgi:hypothetical protein
MRRLEAAAERLAVLHHLRHLHADRAGAAEFGLEAFGRDRLQDDVAASVRFAVGSPGGLGVGDVRDRHFDAGALCVEPARRRVMARKECRHDQRPSLMA